MKLLIDSGSTKADWCLIDGQRIIARINTKGINPFFQTTDQISDELEEYLIPQLNEKDISQIFFYGAGCAFPEKNKIVSAAINRYIGAPVEVNSDLLAAARALCGTKAGIACILGTGSNSCFYDGNEIVQNVSPLGFILGDEGSGAVLGKLLIGDCLKGQLPASLQEKFFKQFNVTRTDILDSVYKQPFPNRYLAGFAPFLAQNITTQEIYTIVAESFKAFFIRNIMHYDYQNYKVHFVGSIAWHFKDVLYKTAAELNINLGRIVKAPMADLIKYHSNK